MCLVTQAGSNWLAEDEGGPEILFLLFLPPNAEITVTSIMLGFRQRWKPNPGLLTCWASALPTELHASTMMPTI